MKNIIYAINTFLFHKTEFFFSIARWGYFLGAFILAAIFSKLIYQKFNLPQKYSELIVGSITWGYDNKFHDYAVLFGFIGGFFMFLLLFICISKLIENKLDFDVENNFHNMIVILSLPAAIWFSGLLTTKNDSLFLLQFSAVMISVAIFLSLSLLLRSKSYEQVKNDDFESIMKLNFMSILMLALMLAALCIGFNRVNALVETHHYIKSKTLYSLIFFITTIYFLFICTISTFAYNIEKISYFQKRIIFISQFFLPLFFLLLIPTPWLKDSGVIFIGYNLNSKIFLFLGLLLIFAYINIYRFYRNNIYTEKLKDPFDVLTTMSIISLLFFLKSIPIFEPTINPDDYHFGEMLFPWFGLVEQHLIPFWDYTPARGLMNYFLGAVTDLFFDGSASALSASAPFVYLIILIVAYPVFRKSLGAGIAALALLFAPYINWLSEIDIIVTVYICFLGQKFISDRPTKYLTTWFVLSVLIILYAPGQGALAILATSPLVLFKLYTAYKIERNILFKRFLIILGISIFILYFTPLGKMLLGAIRYGIEQSGINSIAHGISWNRSFGTANANPWLFEIMRTSWLIVPIIAGILLFQTQNHKINNRAQKLVYIVPILILTIIFVIRAAGRIDPGITRLGFASIWSLSLLLPLLLFGVNSKHYFLNKVLFWSFLVGLLLPYFWTVSLAHYKYKFDPMPDPTKYSNFVNSDSHKIPQIGSAILKPEHLARLSKIKKVLDRVLDPSETYLDLTSRHAHSFYFNRRPLIETGALYNLTTEAQQLRTIQLLKDFNPSLILISADNLVHDGGPISLRSNLIFRYIIMKQNYKIVKIDGLTWLVSLKKINRIDGLNVERIDNIDENPKNILNDIYREMNLKFIPASWGRSFITLEKQLAKKYQISTQRSFNTHSVEKLNDDTYKITGDDPFIRFDISDMNISGKNAGILSFDFECDKSQSNPVLELYWESNKYQETGDTGLIFNSHNGKLIIPLDSVPSWLLAEHILSIRIDVQDKNSCNKFQINNIYLWQRRNSID